MENQEQLDIQIHGVEGVDSLAFAMKEKPFAEEMQILNPSTHAEVVNLLEKHYTPREISLIASILNNRNGALLSDLSQARMAVTHLIAQNNLLDEKLKQKVIPVRRNAKGFPIGQSKTERKSLQKLEVLQSLSKQVKELKKELEETAHQKEEKKES